MPCASEPSSRATRPNEIWHVDVSVVRLVDGTRVYLQAIIDNGSRKLLAFRVSSSFDGSATARLLTEAAQFLPETSAYDVQLFADAGVENLNTSVDAALDVLPIRRVLAQVDVTFSNSMIESFFGTATELVAGLDERRRTARQDRIQANRNARCVVCPRVDERPPGGAGE